MRKGFIFKLLEAIYVGLWVWLCSGNECALHPDYAGESFISISYSKHTSYDET